MVSRYNMQKSQRNTIVYKKKTIHGERSFRPCPSVEMKNKCCT